MVRFFIFLTMFFFLIRFVVRRAGISVGNRLGGFVANALNPFPLGFLSRVVGPQQNPRLGYNRRVLYEPT